MCDDLTYNDLIDVAACHDAKGTLVHIHDRQMLATSITDILICVKAHQQKVAQFFGFLQSQCGTLVYSSKLSKHSITTLLRIQHCKGLHCHLLFTDCME